MLPEKIHLEIVTPERRLLERDVDEVILPGSEGSFGVLPGHAPMLAGLEAGLALVKEGSQEEVMALSAGYAEVQPDKVIVVAATCEKADEIDVERARAKVSAIEREVEAGSVDADPEVVRIRMLKHLARIRAARHRG